MSSTSGALLQYFNQVVRVERVIQSTTADVGFLNQMRRGLLASAQSIDSPRSRTRSPRSKGGASARADGSTSRHHRDGWQQRVRSSVVGVARALEEAGIQPVAYGVCSGSALFGVPLAAGMHPG